MKRVLACGLALSLAALAASCSRESSAPPAAAGPSAAGAAYLLSAAPAGAEGVAQARMSAAHDAEIVVVGRIGGSEHPWIDERAAFTIVDEALLACSDREGDNCPTPWDYCCETKRLPSSKVLVKVVDAAGSPVAGDARTLLGVKELSRVSVVGKAARDDAGNLTILARRLFIHNP